MALTSVDYRHRGHHCNQLEELVTQLRGHCTVTVVNPACIDDDNEEGNSEVHLICTGIKGKPKDFYVSVIYSLNAVCDLRDILEFCMITPTEFLQTKQEEAVLKNLTTFQYVGNLVRFTISISIGDPQGSILMEWLSKCQTQSLNCKLVFLVDEFKIHAYALEPEQRQRRFYIFRDQPNAPVDILRILEWAENMLESCTRKNPNSPLVQLLAHAVFKGVDQMGQTLGIPFMRILNPKFCLPAMMTMRMRNRVKGSPVIYVVPFSSYEFKLSKDYKHCKLAQNKTKLNTIVGIYQQSSHPKAWKLQINVCFHTYLHKLTPDLDKDICRDFLSNLIKQLTTRMKKGNSMFLCEYPLLSTLQAGIIFSLAAFERIAICGNAGAGVHGIFLYKFCGLDTERGHHAIFKLNAFLKDLQSSDPMDKSRLDKLMQIILKEILADYPYMIERLKAYNDVIYATAATMH